MSGASADLSCTFCGKSQHAVRQLIAGPSVFVCDECVELCAFIILRERDPKIADDLIAERIDAVFRPVRRITAADLGLEDHPT